MKRLAVLLGLVPVGAMAQSYFSTFDSGNAQGWVPDQGTWAIQSGAYHGIGHYVNGRVDNFALYTPLPLQDVSVEALMHTDAGSDNVNKMLVLRCANSSNYVLVNFRAAYRNDVVLTQRMNGSNQNLTQEFEYHIANHTQTEWKRCRVDLIGNRAIVYFDGALILDRVFPTLAIRQALSGVNTFSSPGGGDEEVFVDDFRISATLFSKVSTHKVTVGRYLFGDAANLAESDNNRYFFRSALSPVVANKALASLRTTQFVYPLVRELDLRLETSAYPGTEERAYLLDQRTQQLVEIGRRPANISDTIWRLQVPDAQRYVNGHGLVQATLSYYKGAVSPPVGFDIAVDEMRIQAVSAGAVGAP